jgi:hypothetical protein
VTKRTVPRSATYGVPTGEDSSRSSRTVPGGQTLHQPQHRLGNPVLEVDGTERGYRHHAHPEWHAGGGGDRPSSDPKGQRGQADREVPVLAEQALPGDLDQVYVHGRCSGQQLRPDLHLPFDVRDAILEQGGQPACEAIRDVTRKTGRREQTDRQLVLLRCFVVRLCRCVTHRVPLSAGLRSGSTHQFRP